MCANFAYGAGNVKDSFEVNSTRSSEMQESRSHIIISFLLFGFAVAILFISWTPWGATTPKATSPVVQEWLRHVFEIVGAASFTLAIENGIAVFTHEKTARKHRESIQLSLTGELARFSEILLDHIESDSLNQQIPSVFPRTVYMYHQTSAREGDHMRTYWHGEALKFRDTPSRRRLRAGFTSNSFETGVYNYVAELTLKRDRIFIYAQNVDDEKEPAASAVFDWSGLYGVYVGVMVHSDWEGATRISRTLLTFKPVDENERPGIIPDDIMEGVWLRRGGLHWQDHIHSGANA